MYPVCLLLIKSHWVGYMYFIIIDIIIFNIH